MQVTRSALVSQPPEQVFALVAAAEDYPRFLPWCTRADILARNEHAIRACVGFGFRGLEAQMVADVDLQPHRGMDVRVQGWPFDDFRGRWQFEPLGASGCRVSFTARTGFKDAWWARIFEVAAGLIADRLVAAFVARASVHAEVPASAMP